MNRFLPILLLAATGVAQAQTVDVLPAREPGSENRRMRAGVEQRSASVTDVPQGIGYQAVARNANGDILANQPMGLRVSLVADAADGTVLYSETHSATSDAFGVVSIVIGQGTPLGTPFSEIAYDGQAMFVKLEADFSGGTTYTDLGATRVWSVPFALAAGNGFDPTQPYNVDTSEGDSSIVVNVSGTRHQPAFESYTTTNASTSGGMYNYVQPAGSNPTFVFGTYSRVNGQNNAGAANGTGTYAGYNVAEGTSKITVGSIGFAIGAGSGEIVPFGDPQEAQGNFGSTNFGVYGIARNNTNLNIGVFGYAGGNVGAARGNVGVEAQSFTNSSTHNLGLVASAFNSSVRNFGVLSRVTGNTAGDNIGMEISVNNAAGNNLGLIVNASGTNATAGIFNGNVTVNGDLTYTGTFNQPSDARLKTDLQDMGSVLPGLMRTRVYSYRFREDAGLALPSGTHFGVIAQDFAAEFPHLVTERTILLQPDEKTAGPNGSESLNTTEILTVNYTEMIPVLLKAIQEQQAQIDALRAEVERLRAGGN